MLDLMERELAIGRKEVLALASIAVDLRITQLVNPARGVHAVLPLAVNAGHRPSRPLAEPIRRIESIGEADPLPRCRGVQDPSELATPIPDLREFRPGMTHRSPAVASQ